MKDEALRAAYDRLRQGLTNEGTLRINYRDERFSVKPHEPAKLTEVLPPAVIEQLMGPLAGPRIGDDMDKFDRLPKLEKPEPETAVMICPECSSDRVAWNGDYHRACTHCGCEWDIDGRGEIVDCIISPPPKQPAKSWPVGPHAVGVMDCSVTIRDGSGVLIASATLKADAEAICDKTLDSIRRWLAGKEIPDQLADALAVNIMTLRAAMAEAIEHCETCRGLDAHDLGRCARCQTFIRLLHDVHATAKETRK